jgi:hypothetical protein
VVRELLPWSVMENDWAQKLRGYERRYTAVSDYLFDVSRDSLCEYIPRKEAYEDTFDRLGTCSPCCTCTNGSEKGACGPQSVVVAGAIGIGGCSKLFARMQRLPGDRWPLLKSGALDGSSNRVSELFSLYESQILPHANSWW